MQTQKIKVKYLSPDKNVKLILDEHETIELLNVLEKHNKVTHEMLTDKENRDEEWKKTLVEDLRMGIILYKKLVRAANLAGMGE